MSNQIAVEIMARRDALLEERKQLRKQRAGIDARDFAIDRDLADCVAAARLFGVKLEIPKDDYRWASAVSSLKDLRQSLNKQLHQIPMVELFQNQLEATPEQNRETSVEKQSASMPPIKEIVISQLREAGSKGTKAAAITRYILKTYGRKIHGKTTGMTLYRLSKDGLAHRKGNVWYFGPENSGTENPGAATPGPINSEID
jgi:hypothetical protein